MIPKSQYTDSWPTDGYAMQHPAWDAAGQAYIHVSPSLISNLPLNQ